ncbi:MAG TPA: hypothetical protein DCY20_08495 [Firmicutes bacterium]|nr:hypothetical protein [Bacillota bacterium]
MRKLFIAFSFFVLLTGCDVINNEAKTSEYIEPQIYQTYYDLEKTDAENVKQALNDANLSNATFDMLKLTSDPNKIIVLQAKSTLKNVFAYAIDQERFEALNYDMDALIKENEKLKPVSTTGSVQAGDVIVILCFETETIPMHYIGWTAEDNTVEYFIVQYNGKGE